MTKTKYCYSINYSANLCGTEVIEVRGIKRVFETEYEDRVSETVQFLKSDMQTHSLREVDDRLAEILDKESRLQLSYELTSEQFMQFMHQSYDLFSVDTSTLNLN